VIALQKTEHLHLWYFTSFDLLKKEGMDAFLSFDGIDTASEIFLDGEPIGSTENMLIPHRFPLDGVEEGTHELVVHIIPAAIYARQFDIPLGRSAQPYNADSLVLRKAPYMYGWDIMPRIVSAGLWKPVSVMYLPKTRIRNFYLTTVSVNTAEETAKLRLAAQITTDEDLLNDFSIRIEGRREDSSFSAQSTVFGSMVRVGISVDHAKFWMPKNYGAPLLYDVTVTLMKNGEIYDTEKLRFGIRVIELDRTSLAGDDGEFCFKVNGQKIFALGTNWVPTDAFPARQKDLDRRGLEMLDDLGCNMVRCWGGNIYPDEALYDFCDEHGILIWQDFALACGIYPNDERLCRLIREEATEIVCTYRNHPSLALWSGDNECDEFQIGNALRINGKSANRIDPNVNRLTREILPEVIRDHDFARPFLPSSPYIDEVVFRERKVSAEAHLWGPRDFFKGKYYATSPAHFASETGYHGCPSPASLAKFIPKEHLQAYGDEKTCTDRYWLTHAACMEPVFGAAYSYRIPLMTRQVERIFGEIPTELSRYAFASQISQAEAKKYFIERFRISKWRRSGILWWNLIDGWPQISDAIVDYYGCKKLAYSYIKRSQKPFCMMIDEPKDGLLSLYAVNDTREAQTVSYTVTDLSSGDQILFGSVTAEADRSVQVARFPERTPAFYLITWDGSDTGRNHYVASIGDRVSLDAYRACMAEAGFLEALEGFEEC
jgi:beta-mannosidase